LFLFLAAHEVKLVCGYIGGPKGSPIGSSRTVHGLAPLSQSEMKCRINNLLPTGARVPWRVNHSLGYTF